MFTVSITERDGPNTKREFSHNEISIGRAQGNDILLPKSNISKRHARIINNDGQFIIVDAKSTNGTYINGHRLDAPQDLKPGDKIFIGDFVLEVSPALKPVVSKPTAPTDGVIAANWHAEAPSQPEKERPLPPTIIDEAEPDGIEAAPLVEPVVSAPEPAQPAQERHPALQGALQEVHEQLLRSLDLRRLDVGNMSDAELRQRTEEAVRQIVEEMVRQRGLPPGLSPQSLVEQVLNEALGLILESLLQDDGITEILVNHAQQIYVERAGRLEATDKTFSSDQAVLGVIERIVAPLGRRIDESSPMVDARLKDGSRVNAIIPPLALRGPTLTIRKFARKRLAVDDSITKGTLTASMASFLDTCVSARKNILVSGGTGSGKTTTLNVLSSYIPTSERILTIEDAAELKLSQDHVVSLETRPPNIEGRGAITIRDLVRNALRMRPDRIVVGECRGGEALDMLQAMNTGHDGSITTVHANNPRDALARLETMVLMSGLELPVRAIRDQIASAIQIVVHQNRFSDGSRRITHISEISSMEGEIITMQDIFVFKQQGVDAEGRIQGHFQPTGSVPKFYEDLRGMGIDADFSIFQE